MEKVLSACVRRLLLLGRNGPDKSGSYGLPIARRSCPHLSEFQFFLRERFVYDFHCHVAQPPAWRLEIRLEKVVPAEQGDLFPRCIAGRGSPPLDQVSSPREPADFADLFTPRYVGIQGTWPAGQWCQRLGYDEFANAWGNEQVNLAGLAANGPAWYLHQSGAVNNQIKDVGYDVAGNQTQYLVNNLQRVADYDGEGRIWRVRETGTSPQTLAEYSYDGEGRRVKRATGGETTFTVYDMQGRAALEYQAGGTWTGTAGAKYWFTDHLGSTRMRLKADGTEVSRADYEPFGAEIVRTGEGYGGSGENPRKFTGKERDVETGLDYFGARYMSAAQGRFTSADAPFADQHLWDPQSWNLYGYARNNPLRNVDVDGNAAVAVELLRNGQQTFNIPNPGSKLLGAVMIGVGATAAYATDAGFRSDVNRSVSAGVNAFLQAAPNTAYGDPGGLGPIANDGWFMSQDANSSGNGGNNPSGQPGGPGNAAGDPNDPQRKRNGATTEPNLPGKTIVKQDGVTIEHYTRSGDHGPPHMHVSGQGSSTRIGQMGKPLSGDPPLSSRQAQVVQDNRSAIRKAADQIGRWFRFNEE